MDPHRPDSMATPITGTSGGGPQGQSDEGRVPKDCDVATMAAQLVEVRAERDAAVRALDKKGRSDRRGMRINHLAVGTTVVAFALLLPVTIMATWARYSLLDTDGWTRTMGPIATQPAIVEAVSREMTNELDTWLNPQQLVANALPPQTAFLAGPIANAARGYIQDAVTKVLQSPQFLTLWREANRFAHTELVAVLKGGDSRVLQITNGQVVLDLVPLLNSALRSLQGFISGVVGRPVTLPTVTANDLPSPACAKIAVALNRPVPPTCGQIALFPANKLTLARRVVRASNGIVLLLLILTPLLVVLGLWLSRRRRPTFINFAACGLLGVVVARRATMWLQRTLVNAGLPENKAARRVILDQVLHGLFTASYWVVAGLLVTLALAVVTGPYAWVRAIRHHIAGAAVPARHLVTAAAGHATDDAAAAWGRRHHNVLRIAGVVVAALLVLVLSVSFVGLLIVAGLLAIYELWVHRLSQTPPTRAEAPAAPATPSAQQ